MTTAKTVTPAWMYEVWKFPFEIDDYVEVEMPAGARILSVAMQANRPTIWALVQPSASVEARRFRIAGTGHALPPEEVKDPVGTFLQAGGVLVWHVFDLGPAGRP